ncbi:MAG: hypothetical protein LBD14_00740 [Puniceicoccales bacterium]|jgi:D-lyxose ketol-isomerase|nr:hypothetical protein [Puniceicoccales bacterium]
MKLIKQILPLTALAVTLSACCSPGSKDACSAEPLNCPKAKAKTCSKAALKFNNADFYTADGKFNTDAAKDAVIRVMKYHDYKVTDKTRSQLWVSDYGTGRFTELGLAAIMYDNNIKDLYMLQALILLPNQMLPEHWHEKPANLPAKMEGWLVLSGTSYTVGSGEDNLAQFPEIKIPACHKGGVTVTHVTKLTSGEYANLKDLYGHHWQIAGAEGAVILEVANVHSSEAVRHQVPEINKFFLKK